MKRGYYVLLIIAIIVGCSSSTSHPVGKLTFGHMKITSLDIDSPRSCYSEYSQCYLNGCEYCREHPNDCNMIIGYTLEFIIPQGARWLDCNRAFYANGIEIEGFSVPFQARESGDISNTNPLGIGSHPLEPIGMRVCCTPCCDENAEQLCIEQTIEPLCAP